MKRGVQNPVLVNPPGLNIVPSCPDSASFRCVFYPNGHDGESLNLAIGWAVDDPPLDFLALTTPQDVADWLQKRLPFLTIPEEVGKAILSQREGSLRQVIWGRELCMTSAMLAMTSARLGWSKLGVRCTCLGFWLPGGARRLPTKDGTRIQSPFGSPGPMRAVEQIETALLFSNLCTFLLSSTFSISHIISEIYADYI